MFWVAFLDPRALLDAAAAGVVARLEQLRLVALRAEPELVEVVAGLPEHVRRRVLLEPSPTLLASGEIQALVTLDVERTRAAMRDVAAQDIVGWDGLDAMYAAWFERVHLPRVRQDVYTPEGLFPADWRPESLRLELIGSCGAVQLMEVLDQVARERGAAIDGLHTICNFPSDTLTDVGADLRVVVPPFRYMHPETLDGFVGHPDHERLFAETVQHLGAYLDRVHAAGAGRDLYVCGFIEPYGNPLGVFHPGRTLSNLKHFVRRLNDELADWCDRASAAFFVDADEIASAIGKLGLDEGALTYYSHRAVLDVGYDDTLDAECGCPTVPVRLSFDVRTPAFGRALLREVLHRHVIRSQRDRVKAVIVDLDNTLWRGLASDGQLGSYNGRPQGLIEALLVLKQRGVFIAIASKNDERYIREHWHEILHEWTEVPLTLPLALEDFDAVRIDFRPKSVTVAEILAELNVAPEHAVFVDDNPLERQEVRLAFPRLRVLGTELNSVRRELLHSPFTQSDVHTAEDALRSATAHRHTELAAATQAGTARSFLLGLGLRCRVAEVTDPLSADGERAVQLINKTNQWSLNGARLVPGDAEAMLARGHTLLTATVRDAQHHYGLVAAAIVDPAARRVIALVVSCRVIGMGVDDALLSVLLQRFGPLTLAFAETERNRAAADALRRWTAVGEPEPDALVQSVAVPEHIELERPAAPDPSVQASVIAV